MMSNCCRNNIAVFLVCSVLTACSALFAACTATRAPVFGPDRSTIKAEECLVDENGPYSVSFYYCAPTAGYYDIEIAFEPGAGHTGLFIRDSLDRVIDSQADQTDYVATVFLDAGDNLISAKDLDHQSGNGIRSFSVRTSDRTVKLIVAPHEDDEILAFAGTIQQMIADGDIVRIVFLTNGDYFGKELGPIRIAESLNALEMLGVSKDNVIFMGYGDALIGALYSAGYTDDIYEARSGSTGTSADPSNGILDYHLANVGEAAAYSGNNIRSDLKDIITTIRPDTVFTTSDSEWHPDHQAAYWLVDETISGLVDELDYHPVLCQSVVHGETADWPEVLEYTGDNEPVIENFTMPFPSGNSSLDWEQAVHITLTDEQVMNKYEAIGEFTSQNEGGENYNGNSSFNYAFCKRDEFYWTKEY
ncbi:MAG: PIG-L family deacetylase [Clostridiales bacterium]|nr:PIG-L family deacetylase [Clostridiales bacterium]